LEQARRDHARGLRTGTLVTGYPGSPIAGLDLQLAREPELLASLDIRHLPAGNEEQAVTALTGTQMLDAFPHERYDGVVGYWYGKGPGLDRAGDALKHANFAGTSTHGAVVVLSGEDHEAKSSTMPFQQEYAFASAGIPILYPGGIADIRRLGLHAAELSRYSGCWVALKLVSQVCDGGETVDLDPDVDIRTPQLSFAKRTDFTATCTQRARWSATSATRSTRPRSASCWGRGRASGSTCPRGRWPSSASATTCSRT
jgi:indolepyruvate ferredoxin oxidoreductase